MTEDSNSKEETKTLKEDLGLFGYKSNDDVSEKIFQEDPGNSPFEETELMRKNKQGQGMEKS